MSGYGKGVVWIFCAPLKASWASEMIWYVRDCTGGGTDTPPFKAHTTWPAPPPAPPSQFREHKRSRGNLREVRMRDAIDVSITWRS